MIKLQNNLYNCTFVGQYLYKLAHSNSWKADGFD